MRYGAHEKAKPVEVRETTPATPFPERRRAKSGERIVPVAGQALVGSGERSKAALAGSSEHV
jgi:hypothetical protein